MPLISYIYRCNSCQTSAEVTVKQNSTTNPPADLVDGETRPGHWQYDPKSRCLGIFLYQREAVLPPKDAALLKACLAYMKLSTEVPPKIDCEAAIDAGVKDLIASGAVFADFAPPADLWLKVQDAAKQKYREREALKPRTAKEALDNAIRQGASRDGRTLCVAFNVETRQYVTGYSAGLGGLTWGRSKDGAISATPADAKLKDLVETLEGVRKVSDLGREVWVCGEIDSAVKAIRDKGWSLGKLRFAAAEYKDDRWRDIEACGHCGQWC